VPPKSPEEEGAAAERELDQVPKVIVIGKMDGNYAIRLSWNRGVQIISLSRLRFLKEELHLDVDDDPANYVL
jgi:hypothetical protein